MKRNSSYQGKKKETRAILEKLLSRNPDVDRIIPENHNHLRFARILYNDIRQGRRCGIAVNVLQLQ